MGNIYNLAFDFGASSGRLMLSTYDGEKLELEEIHRFNNEPIKMTGRYFWDLPGIFREMKKGLRKVGKRKIPISGIAIDTWGVDYGLIDKDGFLISNPVSYRDARTSEVTEEIHDKVSFKEFYHRMGIQFMELNTVYQIYHDVTRRPEMMKLVDSLLFMPDLFGYLLSGSKYSEYSIASTSQLMDAKKKDWADDIIEKLGLPRKIFKDIVAPGTVVGYLLEDIQQETGLGRVPIIATGGHDTASAVGASPLTSSESAYLSCGTWSLLGVELEDPILNEEAYELNFTNEGGVEGKIRFLKNITGLWILQQLKKRWSEENPDLGYPDIIKAAKEAGEVAFSIDPDDERFNAPLDMVKEVVQYCIEKGQGEPTTMGEIAMAAYNGITSKYAEHIKGLEQLTHRTIDVLHMVGGGIQDKFLCNLTSEKTGKKVIAGPIEASVTGNILMQLKALGHVENIEDCRRIVRHSFELEEYNQK